MAHVLIIDDDRSTCDMLKQAVSRYGHEADTALSLKAAREIATRKLYDVIFLDLKLRDGNGLDYLQEFRSGPGAPEVIILTGYSSPDGAETAIRNGAWDYVQKGASLKALMLPLVRALDYRREKQAGRQNLTLHTDQIVGTSPAMKMAREEVARAARTEAGVLLTGETGTGKELFARAIHENSARKKGPFVVVDCTALPEALVESVLFGHRRGSFTGAVDDRDGLVKLADDGTLFLDEVGELPLIVQKSFLRVLQEKLFRPVGAREEEASNFRVLAATNRDLEAMAGEGTFRDDLLFRLSAFRIHLPPLRDRNEDLLELARLELARRWEQAGLLVKPWSSAFSEALIAYHWPGNVRELLNTIDWVTSSAAEADQLQPHHLPVSIRSRLARDSIKEYTGGAVPEALIPAEKQDLPPLDAFRETRLVQAEQAYLEQLIKQHGQEMKTACRIAGLSRSRLYALLKKHGISRK